MNVPRHLGVILDGNRRFAKRLMLQPWKGHEWGAEKFRKFLEWCNEAGVEEVSAYLFSIQNFNRPKEEFEHLMRIFEKELNWLLQEDKLKELEEKGTRIKICGRLHMLPEKLQKLSFEIMNKTKENKGRRLNMCIGYGGREEIIDAVKNLCEDARTGNLDIAKLDEKEIEEHLWIENDLDLVIRTGGEKRLSNFLPWQCTYAELMFVDKFWPELEKEDFLECIKEFGERKRRFGK